MRCSTPWQSPGGIVAGICTVAGMAILLYRRRTTGPVFSTTTRMDKVMYAVLAAVILLRLRNTASGSILDLTGHYDYRQGASVWFRGLFALWPFTELVHAFSAPIG